MSDDISEIESTARALVALDLQLRRHHYHLADDEAEPVDLIETGAIANLEWDDKDGLWVQFDELITFDITPTGSSICVYANEDPIVTLWAEQTSGGRMWTADWDTDLTHSEQGRFLRRVGDLARNATHLVTRAVEEIRAVTAGEDAEERAYATEVVREWLAR